MNKALLCFLLTSFISLNLLAWGKTGHRIVGLVAEKHLSNKASKRVKQILRKETLAEVGTYMDFIRSNKKYDHLTPWHYATIPDGLTYDQAGTPEDGDAIFAIQKLIEELKTKNFSEGDEAFTLKLLVHLIGDIHQPLHVGNGKDKGGNDFKLEYFWKSTNLHRVWDTEMIEGQKYSYTEYANWINHPTKNQTSDWQSTDVLVWASESKELRTQVYNIPENKKVSYKYDYENINILNTRLLKAGIRLAGVLNEIYG